MWPTFEFWDPPIISSSDEDTNVKFCSLIESKEYQTKNEELGQKGAWPRSRDLLINFGTPPITSGSDEATNVKFCSRIEGKEYQTKNEKLGQKGAWPRSRDLLLNFWTPLLSPVGMKLQTSNFAAWSRVRNTKQKMKNWAKKWRGLGHVTYFWILWPPYYLRFGWSYKCQILQPDRE